ncbi:MAG: type I methionyl aminopeptidase [Clostridia bacterium]|nr:type I methionyl aminopeptidase [Clostridia bacterium]MBQ6467305.1 type I methionyl aminopeptidase [Clostridia bacterium]MBR5772851.1 type I methionyl aminopeptidase [Clostridia bacterium]MBR6335289.1 type I methionyl aminopeptidase [Clostridia bacterium]
MIVLKTLAEIKCMQEAGRIAAGALKAAGEAVEPGVSTATVNKMAEEYIRKHGATPTFKGYNGFPAAACISINDEIIHGIPSNSRIIKAGDIVSIDTGATFKGYVGDNAATFAAGEVSPEAQRLCDVTRESLYEGIKMAVAGNRIGDIGSTIQRYCEERGFSVVREYTGHGVGRVMHEDPSVPNYGTPGRGVRLLPGMTIAIEPMINQGVAAIKQLPDGWTVKTKDGKLSAHFENTIAITSGEPLILTMI